MKIINWLFPVIAFVLAVSSCNENEAVREMLDNTEWSIKHKASTELTHVWTSSINGNVSIIADKTLFGRAAGENLSDHFNVWDVNSCVVSSPELENAR